MAGEAARKFVEALEQESSLQAQFSMASPNNLDAVVDFASGKGYVFTKDDLKAVLKNYPHSKIVDQLRQYVR